MNSKIVIALLIVLTALVTFLSIQNFRLAKKLYKLSKVKEEVEITPLSPMAKPINRTAASPFDKPNTDPMEDLFPPESAKMPELTVIKFDRTVHDFGMIDEGEVVRTVFKFTNIGKNPLIITRAKGSCGCTVPRWPEHPIRVGGSDEIDVEFNSAGKRGETEKTVTVTSNTTPPSVALTIKSTVIPKNK